MPTCFEALVERGVKKGLEQGLEKGLEQGLEKGLEQGLARGREEGLMMGRIRTLQEVLLQPVTPPEALALLSLEDLQSLAGRLQDLLEATRPPAR